MEGQLPWDQLAPVSLPVSPQLGLVLFQEVQLPADTRRIFVGNLKISENSIIPKMSK